MIKRFMSLFSVPEKKKTPVNKKRSKGPNSTNTRALNALKKEVEKMQTESVGLNEELARIKEQVSSVPDHSMTLAEFHKKHESHEKRHDWHEEKLEKHAERFSQIESKMNDHRIDVIELKSKLAELNHLQTKFDSLTGKIAQLEDKLAQREPAVERVARKVARASAPEGSLVEQYHSLAPSTKKIFSLLLGMHIEHKGKWVPLSNLRNRAYPDSGESKSTLAAMAKAIRPLYESGFVEKKRDKSYVYVAASKRGRDAAKEVGLEQQAEKFDKAFAEIG